MLRNPDFFYITRGLKAEIIKHMKRQAEKMDELYLNSFNSEDRLANGRRFFGPMPKPLHIGVFELYLFKKLVEGSLDVIKRDYDMGTTPEIIAFQLLRDIYYPEWENYRNYE